ncbi:hypothetical protein OUZ56_009499 [Daphnia magna]|uniref:Uncharacterized protein n=1 Tax=Daphnia magna TaxID=35525 RepID=A0ABR0AG71_9CRUS|nr:hypothetical protein OUZ56_009499 [Daphnia magna]
MQDNRLSQISSSVSRFLFCISCISCWAVVSSYSSFSSELLSSHSPDSEEEATLDESSSSQLESSRVSSLPGVDSFYYGLIHCDSDRNHEKTVYFSGNEETQATSNNNKCRPDDKCQLDDRRRLDDKQIVPPTIGGDTDHSLATPTVRRRHRPFGGTDRSAATLTIYKLSKYQYLRKIKLKEKPQCMHGPSSKKKLYKQKQIVLLHITIVLMRPKAAATTPFKGQSTRDLFTL